MGETGDTIRAEKWGAAVLIAIAQVCRGKSRLTGEFLHDHRSVAPRIGNPLNRRRVAIVGGGIVGCATAYLLARSGMEPILIERDAIAAHASGHNAGNLNPLHATPPVMRPLALEAFALHRKIAAELAELNCANFAMAPAARIHLGCEEAQRQDLEEIAALFAGTPGFSSHWLEGGELARAEPGLARDFRFGIVTSGNLSVDSADYARAMAQGALRLGATLVHGSVTGIVASGARVTGVRTSAGVIECDDVVFATGPWIADVNSWLGIDADVEPVKGELLLMQMPDGAPDHDLAWGSTVLYRRRGDQLWIGGTMEKCGFDCTPSEAAKKFLLENAIQMVPAIRHAVLLDQVAALRPMAASPIAQRAEGWRNVTIANGGGSKGVLLSAVIARQIHDLVAGSASIGTEVRDAASLS